MKRAAHRSPRTDHRSPSAALVSLLLAASVSYGFLGFGARPAAVGNQLYAEGKYDEAVNKYGEALVDEPESPALNFNMGDAHYKAGNYTEALASFGRVRAPTESQQESRVAYNVGNVKFRQAASLEAEKPQDALKGYAEALVAYRRSLGIDPNDRDAKFNYEFTVKRMKDLKDRIEKEKQEQQQQQDQQDQQPQEDQEQDQQQAQDQQQQDQQQQGEQPEDQQQEQETKQDQGQEEQQQEEKQQQGQQGEGEEQQAEAQEAEEGAEKDEMSKREASALVDAARNDELRPEDFIRQAQGGALAQPAQDW